MKLPLPAAPMSPNPHVPARLREWAPAEITLHNILGNILGA